MGIIEQKLSNNHISIKKKTSLHQGFCPIELYELTQQRFDGNWTPIYTREFLRKNNAVGALPYDPKHNKIVLIEQFRIGALGQNFTPWLIEIVAGIVDRKESDKEVAYREMREEACLEIEALMPIYDYFPSPGYSTEKIKLFCAKVDSTKAPKFGGLKEEHEDIKIHVVPTADAFAAVRSGQINNAAAIIALQWLELNMLEVNTRWGINF